MHLGRQGVYLVEDAPARFDPDVTPAHINILMENARYRLASHVANFAKAHPEWLLCEIFSLRKTARGDKLVANGQFRLSD